MIDLPIQSNLHERLSLTEYIISCYEARKEVVDLQNCENREEKSVIITVLGNEIFFTQTEG